MRAYMCHTVLEKTATVTYFCKITSSNEFLCPLIFGGGGGGGSKLWPPFE